MTKRILHIIPSLDRSGAEKQLALLAARLPRESFDVHVCALTRGGPLAADLQAAGVPLTLIGKRWKLDPRAYWQLERHVRQLRPDLVQTWLFAGNAYGRAAALRAGVPVVVASERSVDPWKAWHQFAIDRLLARRTRSIVVNSPGVRDFYVRHGLPAEKFVVIPNGVEPAPASNRSRESLLEELDLPSEARLMAAVGRLWPQKRLKDVIWATDLLRVLRDDAHLLIIGDGPQRARLERYSHLCGLDRNVHFLGVRHDVLQLLPHCDLLWLASGYEGMPNVILEAMAAGVPVVATDIPGNNELVVHGETGFLVPVGDRAGFGRYAHKLLGDRSMGQRLGEAGRRRVAACFSVDQMVARHVALYRNLLGI